LYIKKGQKARGKVCQNCKGGGAPGGKKEWGRQRPMGRRKKKKKATVKNLTRKQLDSIRTHSHHRGERVHRGEKWGEGVTGDKNKKNGAREQEIVGTEIGLGN